MVTRKRTAGRVNVPRKPDDLFNLLDAILTKHESLDAKSPLNVLEDVAFDTLKKKVDDARIKHREAEEYKRKSEEAYRSRDILINELSDAIKSCSRVLKAVYSKNPKQLGEWGFVVEDSIQRSKPSDTPTE